MSAARYHRRTDDDTAMAYIKKSLYTWFGCLKN